MTPDLPMGDAAGEEEEMTPPLHAVVIKCQECQGTGNSRHAIKRRCRHCEGKGYFISAEPKKPVTRAERKARRRRKEDVTCRDCGSPDLYVTAQGETSSRCRKCSIIHNEHTSLSKARMKP